MAILRTLWGIWVLIVWIFFQTIFFVLLILGYPFLSTTFFQKFILSFAIWCTNIYTYLWLAPVTIQGKNLLPKNTPMVIVSNHNSTYDIIVNAFALRGVIFKFLAKFELTQIPIMGYVIKHLCVCVKRNESADRQKSFNNLKESLNKGFSVLIYPEGTRNITDNILKNFYDGAFKLAKENNVPLAICVLINTKKINHPSKPLQWKWGHVHAIFPKVIMPEEHKNMDIETLKNVTYQTMLQTLEQFH
jgi:1-acyl-sn-glycerol-3-phosphate acyltransferase